MDWESNGVRGVGNRPALAGNFSGTLLVVGSAPSVWEDLARAPRSDRLVCNHMAFLLYEPVQHMASLHPNIIPSMRSWRRSVHRTIDGHCHTHSNKEAPEVDAVWRFDGAGHCYTGIFAAVVGLAMGYERIILCGCPQDDSGYVWKPTVPHDHGCRGAFLEWQWWKNDVFKGRVKSMSGKTREWLGAPDGI